MSTRRSCEVAAASLGLLLAAAATAAASRAAPLGGRTVVLLLLRRILIILLNKMGEELLEKLRLANRLAEDVPPDLLATQRRSRGGACRTGRGGRSDLLALSLLLLRLADENMVGADGATPSLLGGLAEG